MDVLDERLHALSDRALSFSAADARQFVAGEGLLEGRHERTVSREINCRCFPKRLATCRHVQADECLPSTGYAGDEHNRLSRS